MKPMKRFGSILIALLLTLPVFGQNANISISKARLLGKTAPLIDLPIVPPGDDPALAKKRKAFKLNQVPNFQHNRIMPTPDAESALPKNGDPLVAGALPENLTDIFPLAVYEGPDETDSNIFPPDPCGDASNDHYLVMTNASGGALMEVLDKQGNTLFGPANVETIWSQFDVTGIGDPIVLWDQQAERWLLTEIVQVFGAFSIATAVSETADPLGAWYAYEYQSPFFPDYPKYGIWNDAYYITINDPFNDVIPIITLNRDQMLNGLPEVDIIQLEEVPKFGDPEIFQVLTPADMDGPLAAPADSPNYAIRIKDDAWDGVNEDALEVWSIYLDWDSPFNSFVDGPLTLPTAPFNSNLCPIDIFSCLEQPNGMLVSALQHVIMYRIAYRNFGTHESLVLNHSVQVDPNTNQAGVRWYELRKENGEDWSIYQQGTVAPDNRNRFMGTIAMDGFGNILLGYSLFGQQDFLSLAYTGRFADDPLGEMTINEFVVGTGTDFNQVSRWGDYQSMIIDPLDDRTFWFTGEYMKGNFQWGTKIAKINLQRDSNDLSVTNLLTPQSSGFLTNAEPVTARIFNNGLLPQSNFELSYRVDNGPIQTETIANTLASGEFLEHTFQTTVDLDLIQSYDFQVFVSLDTDTNQLNDTLNRVVEKLPRYDARPVNLSLETAAICAEELSTDIILQNEGVLDLTSLEIYYSLNNAPFTLINWTGNLPFGATEAVPVNVGPVLEGLNEFTVYTQLPNGELDENPENDTLTRTFNGLGAQDFIRLELTTDLYPTETSWQIFDENNQAIFSGGGYMIPQNLYVEELCIGEGCFTFRIFDSFGDGLSYAGVEGDYEIFNAQGQLLASLIEPNFGFEEVNEFCTTVDCALEASILVNNVTVQGANDGQIIINVTAGIPPFQYSIDGGQTFVGTTIFDNLPPGDYEIVILDALLCEVTDLATITEPTGIFATNEQPIQVLIAPNPTNDLIKVEVYGLQDLQVLPVRLFNNMGQIVKYDRLTQYRGYLTNTINLYPLPAGVYYLQLQHESATRMVKIVRL